MKRYTKPYNVFLRLVYFIIDTIPQYWTHTRDLGDDFEYMLVVETFSKLTRF